MKICQFTKKELDTFRKECNFTDLERSCFELKAKGQTNYQLAMELNICDSTVSATMKSVRSKITSVLEQKAEKPKTPDNIPTTLNYLLDFVTKFLENTPFLPESHSTKEWAELPDKVSIKDKWYVVTDYRTDDDVSVPRFKFGDGVTMVSKLPFVTAAITDNDVLWWDLKAQKVQ